jgi:hypothetical protein
MGQVAGVELVCGMERTPALSNDGPSHQHLLLHPQLSVLLEEVTSPPPPAPGALIVPLAFLGDWLTCDRYSDLRSFRREVRV